MDERISGVLLMLGGLTGLCLYGALLFFGDLGFFVLKVTAFSVVESLLLMSAWMGFMLLTTPSKSVMDDIGAEGDDEGL